MASGRSVVGFDVAGLAESIGDAGAVVAHQDLPALTEQIVLRLADRSLAMEEGVRGRLRAVTLYDRHEAVAATDRAIRSLLKGLPGQRPRP
jgi:hypothetical protein